MFDRSNLSIFHLKLTSFVYNDFIFFSFCQRYRKLVRKYHIYSTINANSDFKRKQSFNTILRFSEELFIH